MSFYSSNQTKLKTYTADRRVEQSNGNIQQAKVYADIASKQGDIETADRLAKLGMSVLGKIAKTEVPIVNKQGGVVQMTVIGHIKSMIESGSLSSWWDAVKKIPKKKLSPKARVVQDDIKHNSAMKEILNEQIKSAVDSMAGPNMYPVSKSKEVGSPVLDETIKSMIQTITGGDESIIKEFDDNVDVRSLAPTMSTQYGFNAEAGDNDQDLSNTQSKTIGKEITQEQSVRDLGELINAWDEGKVSIDQLKSKFATISKRKQNGLTADSSLVDRFAAIPQLSNQTVLRQYLKRAGAIISK